MITFKGIIIPNNRRKDGTYNVKIRVTFRGVSRRLPTTLYCTQSDLTRGLKIKNADILNKVDELIGRMRRAVAEISPFDLERADVDWVVRTMRANLTAEDFRLDFFEFAEEFIKCKSEHTRRNYVTAINALRFHLGRDRLDINDITKAMLIDFRDGYGARCRMFWRGGMEAPKDTGKAKGEGATSRYLGKLEHIFKAAKKRYNDEDTGRILIPKSPFSYVDKIPSRYEGQKSLGLELMQRIIDARTESTAQRLALDLFIVSFCLMGANMADLWAARPFRGDVWIYQRQKTRTRRGDKAEMQIRIPPQALPYIERLKGRGGWWLNRLHTVETDNANACTRRVNRSLDCWARLNGIEPFTFYAARHTFATVARNKAGLEKALVDEMLCHIGDYGMADIYIERDWQLLNDANEKVLALLQFPL